MWLSKRKVGTLVLGSSRSTYPCEFDRYGCRGVLKRSQEKSIVSPQVVCSECGNVWLSDSPQRCSAQLPTPHELHGWLTKHPEYIPRNQKLYEKTSYEIETRIAVPDRRHYQK